MLCVMCCLGCRIIEVMAAFLGTAVDACSRECMHVILRRHALSASPSVSVFSSACGSGVGGGGGGGGVGVAAAEL